LTSFGFAVDDAWVGLREQHEQRWCENGGNDCTHTLGKPLLDWRCAEQETNTEVAHQIGSLVSTHTGNGSTEQIQTLCVGGCPVLALGGTTENDLRGLGGSSERSDIGDTSALDGKEGEEEGQEDGEQGHADWHVVLHTHDDADTDDDYNEQRCPVVPLDFFLGFCRILNQVTFLLHTLLLEEGVGDTLLAAVHVVQPLAGRTPDCLGDEAKELVLQEQLSERDDNHEQYTGPEEPETWAGVVLVGGLGSERAEAHVAAPVLVHGRVFVDNGRADSDFVVDESWTNDTPCDHTSAEVRDGDVKADEDTRANECGCELDEPALRVG
jgi:hypothetical protein